MHISFKIIKTLLYSYSALHVSGTLAPIIRSLQILHIQPPVTMCRWVGCIFQLWSVYCRGATIERFGLSLLSLRDLMILKLMCIWLVFIHCYDYII
jgi:hypothetical protein